MGAVVLGMGVVMLGLAAAATWEAGVRASLPPPPANPLPQQEFFRAVAPVRPHGTVYPYSVIPGGVRSQRELRRAAGDDPVVASHFSDFALDRARVARVDHPRRVHVSYRVGNRVYWTRKTVQLASGEGVLTDGVNEARARCGNRIADDLMGDASLLEPPEEVLDTPLIVSELEDEPVSQGIAPSRALALFAATGFLPTGGPFIDAPTVDSSGQMNWGGLPGGGFPGAPGFHRRESNPPGGGLPPGTPGTTREADEPGIPEGPPESDEPPEEPPVDAREVPEPGVLTLLALSVAAAGLARRLR